MYLLGRLDLRWSSFLLSANDLSQVSPVLLTRLKVVHVRKPTHSEIEKVIETMIKEACDNEDFSQRKWKTFGKGLRPRRAGFKSTQAISATCRGT